MPGPWRTSGAVGATIASVPRERRVRAQAWGNAAQAVGMVKNIASKHITEKISHLFRNQSCALRARLPDSFNTAPYNKSRKLGPP